jgi:hypothetical protein
MPASRKRSTSKARAGTAGKRKTAQRKNVPSSSKKRAAGTKSQDSMKPGGGRKTEKPVIDTDSDQEVYGVLMSERGRGGESNPTVPQSKTRNTRSTEPKRTPPTGVAKSRTTTRKKR